MGNYVKLWRHNVSSDSYVVFKLTFPPRRTPTSCNSARPQTLCNGIFKTAVCVHIVVKNKHIGVYIIVSTDYYELLLHCSIELIWIKYIQFNSTHILSVRTYIYVSVIGRILKEIKNKISFPSLSFWGGCLCSVMKYYTKGWSQIHKIIHFWNRNDLNFHIFL